MWQERATYWVSVGDDKPSNDVKWKNKSICVISAIRKRDLWPDFCNINESKVAYNYTYVMEEQFPIN